MQTRDAVLIVVIAVVAMAAAGLVIAGSADSDGIEWDFPEDVTDEDKEYPEASAARTDFEAQQAETASVLADPSKTADDMMASIDALAEDYLQIRDWYSWVLKDYYLDIVTYSQPYQDWEELVNDTVDSYFSTVKAGLLGSCGKAVEEALESAGADPDVFRSYDEMTDEEKELNTTITALETQYDSIRLSDEYVSETKRYTDMAEVYIRLVQANNDLAQLKGYDNYAEYAYSDVYGRDYGPEDAEGLIEILPTAAVVMTYTGHLIGSEGQDATYAKFRSSQLDWMDDLTGAEVIEAVASYTDTIADRYADLMDYLQRCDLIFLNEQTDDGLTGQAYTTDLFMQSSAYMLISGYSGSDAVTTVAHEFGHASAMCLNRGLTSCMDVDEIHSNGMEALFATSGASSLRGSGAAMSAQFLYGAAQTIITGIMFTEIELYAYETEAETGALTVEMLQSRFESILGSVGLGFGSECDGLYWTNVPHLFSSPMYYVSYVTANMDAVDIFVRAVEDHDAAEEVYISLVGQRDVDGYVEAVEKAGLIDAFDADDAKRLLGNAYYALAGMARGRGSGPLACGGGPVTRGSRSYENPFYSISHGPWQ